MTPLISIIIPTYKEVDNISTLAIELDNVFKVKNNLKYEIIFVDDNSQDGTVDRVRKLAAKMPVKLVVRKNKRSLSRSVVEGFSHAEGEFLVVMDADLSHPPERIPRMIDLLNSGRADFVVGSRYVDGASIDEGWSFFRYLNSRAAVLLAALFTDIRDPMSGFFACRRHDLPDLDTLCPVGYKIILEMIVKGNFTRIEEIPIHFSERQFGQSKLNIKEQWLYLIHVWRLFRFCYPRISRYIQFALVGGTGFLVDMTVYLGTQRLFGTGHLLARAISFWPAVTWNWALNRRVTFEDRKKSSKRIQWMKFASTSLCGFCISWGVYYLLSSAPFFENYLIFDLIAGICLASVCNFLISDHFVFPF